MSWLLRLYPRWWRRRYADEVAALIESEPRRFRLFLDLVAGAVDARVSPQPVPVAAPSGGKDAMHSILRLCSRPRFTREERKAMNAWLIGGSLALVGLSLVLHLAFDLELLGRTLLFSAYPLALILSTPATWLKPYRRPVRWILISVAMAAMFLFFLGVTLLAEML